MDRSGSNNARGQFQFNGQVTGNAAADFVLGFSVPFPTPDGILPVQYRQRTYAFYVQDEWKATRNLTINLGARFDHVGIVFEKNGLPRGLRLDKPGGYLYPRIQQQEHRSSVRSDRSDLAATRIGLPAFGEHRDPAGGGVYNNVNQMIT